MIHAMRSLFKDNFLGIQAKLVFPLAITIILLVVVLSPLTNRIINSQIEEEADRRLEEVADSIGALIENSETLARNNAALLAKQPEIVNAFTDLRTSGSLITDTQTSLNLQELSLYTSDFKPGDLAYFYGGPTVARRLQVSADSTRIRDELIAESLETLSPVSNVAVAPQNSQIMGVAPVFSGDNNLLGVVVATFYMDQEYINELSEIINTDVALIKDNAIIATTIDQNATIETLINDNCLTSNETPAVNVEYSNGEEYRILGRALIVSGNQQGTVIVAQPLENLFAVRRNIQIILITVTGVFGLTALWFWIAAFLTFTRPLAQMTGRPGVPSGGRTVRSRRGRRRCGRSA
jgi:hypothetical protein